MLMELTLKRAYRQFSFRSTRLKLPLRKKNDLADNSYYSDLEVTIHGK